MTSHLTGYLLEDGVRHLATCDRTRWELQTMLVTASFPKPCCLQSAGLQTDPAMTDSSLTRVMFCPDLCCNHVSLQFQ